MLSPESILTLKVTIAYMVIFGIFFIGFPLFLIERARVYDNKKNNTNKNLGEWMAYNKWNTVGYFLAIPGIILLLILIGVGISYF